MAHADGKGGRGAPFADGVIIVALAPAQPLAAPAPARAGPGDRHGRSGVCRCRPRRAGRRSRHHVPDDRAGKAQIPACLAEARWSRRRAKAGATVPCRRHARPSVSGRVVRHRDHRLRPAQRPRSAAGDRRNPTRARAGRPGGLARFQPAGERMDSLCLPRVFDRRGRDTRLGPAPRSRHLSLYSRLDSAVSAPRRWHGCSRIVASAVCDTTASSAD